MNSVILINDSGADVDLIDSILVEANLPNSRILIVLSDGYLADGYLGCCIPRELLNYQNLIGIFNPHLNQKWDLGVALSVTGCNYKDTHPAYFTYLLGHELGHAYICIKNITVHIHSCLIQNFIIKASSKKITQWHKLPHEQLFDLFGISLAEKIFSRHQLREELKSLIKDPNSKDRDRLKFMLSLPTFQNFNGLRENLIQFSKPYKAELIALWEEEKSRSTSPSLLDLVPNFENLFD